MAIYQHTGRSNAKVCSEMRESCFTLLELLVVVGVITILMALLLPALGKVKQKARDIGCTNNEKQLFLAISSFAVDHDGLAPGSDYNSGKGVGQMIPMSSDCGALPVSTLIKDNYLPNDKIFICPETMTYNPNYTVGAHFRPFSPPF